MPLTRSHLLFLMLMAAPAAGSAGEMLQRHIEFRDGSTLRVSLPNQEIAWTRIDETGQFFVEPKQLAEIEEIVFVTTPVTEQIEQVRNLVNQLGDNDFHQRERAQKQLLSLGDRFRSLLQTIHDKSRDAEVRWRLAEVMKTIPSGDTGTSRQYDTLRAAAAGEPSRGDAGRWRSTAHYRGREVELSRENVLAVRTAPQQAAIAAEPEVPGVERIESDEDDAFPQPLTRIDFDRSPSGELLSVGTDIADVFVPFGCTFSSSFPESFVGVQAYNVGGRSNGKCAATHDPIYQGIITIRFCVPGNAEVAAGVRSVGFWTSHIAPDGTALEAYDARDRRLGVIRTTRRTKDWLAIRSSVPIAYIKIVPDPAIDRDYAIDDLTFDSPQPLLDAGDPQWYVLILSGGERLKFKKFNLEGESVVLEEVSIGFERLEVPLNEVAALFPQLVKHQTPSADHAFVMLADGSVLQARAEEGLQLARWKEPVDRKEVAALWGGLITPAEPTGDEWVEDGALLLTPASGGEYEPKVLGGVTLGRKWIESPNLSPLFDFTYHTSATVWFQRRPRRVEGSGLLRLVGSEELVLAPGGFELKEWSAAGVTVSRGGTERQIPLDEIISLLFPQTAP